MNRVFKLVFLVTIGLSLVGTGAVSSHGADKFTTSLLTAIANRLEADVIPLISRVGILETKVDTLETKIQTQPLTSKLETVSILLDYCNDLNQLTSITASFSTISSRLSNITGASDLAQLKVDIDNLVDTAIACAKTKGV